MGFSRQEYLSGLPFPSPGTKPGIKPQSPALAGRRFTAGPHGKLSGDAPGINSFHLQGKLISKNNVSSYTLGNEGEVSKPSKVRPLMDRGAWWAVVYGVMKSWTQLKQLSSSSNNNNGIDSE